MKTLEFIFPTFVFQGDGNATSNQISEYCSQWYAHTTGNSTYINIVYFADVMPVYAVPNVRVYKVLRGENGFTLEPQLDIVDMFVGLSRISDYLPFETIYEEAYWWEFIDWVSYSPPEKFPTVRSQLPYPELDKIPWLTDNGFINLTYPSIVPEETFFPGDMFPGATWFDPPNDDGQGWSFSGFSRCAYSWSYNTTPIGELFPNLQEQADYGSYHGLGKVLGSQDYGRYQTSEMFFEHAENSFQDGGIKDAVVIHTLNELPPYLPLEDYYNSGIGCYPLQFETTELFTTSGGVYTPSEWTISNLSGSIRSYVVTETHSLLCGDLWQRFDVRRNNQPISSVYRDTPSTGQMTGTLEIYRYYFVKETKSLRDRFPSLPAFQIQPTTVEPPSLVIPILPISILGGLGTQATQAIVNMLLLSGGAGKKETYRE